MIGECAEKHAKESTPRFPLGNEALSMAYFCWNDAFSSLIWRPRMLLSPLKAIAMEIFKQ